MKHATPESDKANDSFEDQAKLNQSSVWMEFFDFLRHNKKWWLTPIVVVLLVLSLFIALTNSAIGPFIYVLF